MARGWEDWSARERGEIVRQHAMPRVRIEPGMDAKALAKLFQITEDQVAAVLAGADFPDDDKRTP